MFFSFFVKSQNKIGTSLSDAMQALIRLNEFANLFLFIICSYLSTKEIHLQLILLVNFRTCGLKTLISDQLHNSSKGPQLLFVVVVVLLNLSDHSFYFAN